MGPGEGTPEGTLDTGPLLGTMLNVGEAEGASGKTVVVLRTVVPDVGSGGRN